MPLKAPSRHSIANVPFGTLGGTSVRRRRPSRRSGVDLEDFASTESMFNVSDAYPLKARVYMKRAAGGVVAPQTLSRLVKVSARTNLPIVVTQGSGPGTGAVHNTGPGVIDLRTRGYNASQVMLLLIALDEEGFATWDLGPESAGRGPGRVSGFSPHIHAVDINHPGLSPAAERQVTAYLNREVIPRIGRLRPRDRGV